MSKLDELYSLVNLAQVPPQLDKPRQLGFVKNDKGETVFLNIEDASRTVMVFELLEGKPRGGHYHIEKEEYVYVIEGNAKLYVWLPEKPEEQRCIELKKADWLHIKAGLSHLYVGAPKALILEQSPVVYSKEHTINTGFPPARE